MLMPAMMNRGALRPRGGTGGDRARGRPVGVCVVLDKADKAWGHADDLNDQSHRKGWLVPSDPCAARCCRWLRDCVFETILSILC